MSDVERKLDTEYLHFAGVELLNYEVGYPDLIIKSREKVKKADRKLFQNVHKFTELKEVCPVKSSYNGELRNTYSLH